MECVVCKKDLNERNSTGYCRTCNNQRPETREKNSRGLKLAHASGRSRSFTDSDRLKSENILRKKCSEDIEKDPHHFYSGKRLTNYLRVNNVPYVCSVCKLSDWQGSPITLEVDHIDGIKQNNILSNLRFICPNCHSQTSTYKGRNISREKRKSFSSGQKISDEEILQAFEETENIRQTLIKVGLDPQGANYNRVYEIVLKSKAS